MPAARRRAGGHDPLAHATTPPPGVTGPTGSLAEEPDDGPAAVDIRFIALVGAGILALFMSFGAIVQVLIPEQIEGFDPRGKEATLSWVLAAGALVSMIANPLFGALSDLTTSRFGRRRPWMVVGALASIASLMLLSAADEMAGVMVGWMCCQLTLAAVYAPLLALVPDRVPVRQRGLVSACIGVAQVLGPIVGLALTAAVSADFGPKYLSLAIALLTAVGALAAWLPEQARRRRDVPAFDRREFLTGFWVDPRRHPDFAWAWITRFLVILGFSLVTTYLLYFLRDEVRYESTVGGDAEGGVLVLNVVSGICLLATIFVGGIASDRLDRRKPFVIAATGVIAIGPVLLAVAPSWGTAVLAAVALGAGFGIYLAVDVALITQVLPEGTEHARHLGVINVANTLPQTAAPVLAGVLVTQLGYPAMFAVAAVVTVLGAILVQPIRSVR
ncbi:MAG: MFS transporter [Angustibacter sp.]